MANERHVILFQPVSKESGPFFRDRFTGQIWSTYCSQFDSFEAANVAVCIIKQRIAVAVALVIQWDFVLKRPKEDDLVNPKWEKLEVKEWPD